MSNLSNSSQRKITVDEMTEILDAQNQSAAAEALTKYGFFNENIYMRKVKKDFITFAPVMPDKFKELHGLSNDVMTFDVGTNYFWFHKMTPIVISVFIDFIPYWKADNFSGYLPSKMKTGKDYSNAVKTSDFPLIIEKLAGEIDKLTGAKMENHPSWMADNLILYQHMLSVVTTHVTPPVQKQLTSSALFIEQGFVFSDCLQLMQNKISFEDYENSGLDTSIPVDWIIASIAK